MSLAGNSKSKGNGGEDSKHFAVGDVVLGKIKGYPPWPGILVDDDNVPQKKVLTARPGKSYFIVRFFPAADYGFNKAHELRKLQKREIEAFLGDPHKKGSELREAYELARDPEAWNSKQNRIVKEEEEKGTEEVDMLEDDDEEVQPTKKRKSSNAQGSSKKVKSSSNSGSASKPKPQVKANSAPRKSAGTEEAEGEEEQLDPETKKVRGWRHSLQRGFLSKEGVINPDEMDSLHKTLKQVEDYNGITAEVLRVTKIGKVMRRVVQLPLIPRDDEFAFRERARKLCDQWASVFTAAKGPSEGASAGAPTSETNGTSQSKQQVKAETKEDEVTNDTTEPPAAAAADESTLSAVPT